MVPLCPNSQPQLFKKLRDHPEIVIPGDKVLNRKQKVACKFLPEFGPQTEGPSGDGGDSGPGKMLGGYSRLFEGRGFLLGLGRRKGVETVMVTQL